MLVTAEGPTAVEGGTAAVVVAAASRLPPTRTEVKFIYL